MAGTGGVARNPLGQPDVGDVTHGLAVAETTLLGSLLLVLVRVPFFVLLVLTDGAF